MSDQPDLPALPDDELRETLDLLSTVIASVSDRVDSQTVAMDRLTKTVTEARQAAFAACAQTDPKQFGVLIGTKIVQELRGPFNAIDRHTNDLRLQTEKTEHVLKQMKDDRSALYAHLRSKEIKAERLKYRLPWYGLGAAVLALALSVMLPRFYVSNSTTCTAIGAEWTTTTQGGRACVFFGE